jgi:hypothetical protein
VGFQTGRAQAYYPGDSEVDWICTDAYPYSAPQGAPYPSLSSLVRPFLNWSKAHPKPLMIGEFGIPQRYGASARASWLDQARNVIDAAPRIKAVGYFDSSGTGGLDYRIGSDSPVTAAFRRLASDPRLAGAA